MGSRLFPVLKSTKQTHNVHNLTLPGCQQVDSTRRTCATASPERCCFLLQIAPCSRGAPPTPPTPSTRCSRSPTARQECPQSSGQTRTEAMVFPSVELQT